MNNLIIKNEPHQSYFDDVRLLKITSDNLLNVFEEIIKLVYSKSGNILIGVTNTYLRIGLSYAEICKNKAILEYFEYKITSKRDNFKYSIKEVSKDSNLFVLSVKIKRDRTLKVDKIEHLKNNKLDILNEITSVFFSQNSNESELSFKEENLDNEYSALLDLYENNNGVRKTFNEIFDKQITKRDGEFYEAIEMFKNTYKSVKTQLICTFFEKNRKNSDEYVIRKTYNSNILKMYNYAFDFILKYGANNTPSYKGFPYPIKAIKELLLNAFIHSNYENEGIIEINVYPNKIEIVNPGEYLGSETPNINYKDSNITYYRNGKIAEIFSLIGVTTNCGNGLKEVYNSYQNTSLLKRPILYSKNGKFTAVLHNFFEFNNQKGIVSAREKARNEKIILQKEVYDLLKINKELTYNSLKYLLNHNLSRTVFYKQVIKPLMMQNIISKTRTKNKNLILKLS